MNVFSERLVTVADVDLMLTAFAAPHARAFMQQPTAETVRASIGRAGRAERIVLDAAGAPVALWRASVEDAWLCELRTIVAVAPGTGAGSWALQRALMWAFDTCGAHRTYLYVTAANVRARALYERHALQHEGTERDGFRNAAGTFEDLCVYGILEHEYVTAAASGSWR